MRKAPPKTPCFSFSDLTATIDQDDLAEFYGVSIDTIRRWKRAPNAIPAPAARLTAARFQGRLDLIYGHAWRDITISEAGIHIPGFRRPFTPGELRESFWRLQELVLLRHNAEQLKRDLESAQKDLEAAEQRTAYYRGLVTMEARLGLALANIANL